MAGYLSTHTESRQLFWYRHSIPGTSIDIGQILYRMPQRNIGSRIHDLGICGFITILVHKTQHRRPRCQFVTKAHSFSRRSATQEALFGATTTRVSPSIVCPLSSTYAPEHINAPKTLHATPPTSPEIHDRRSPQFSTST